MHREGKIYLGLCLLWMTVMSASSANPVLTLNSYKTDTGCPRDGVDAINITGTVNMAGVSLDFSRSVSLVYNKNKLIDSTPFSNCSPSSTSYFHCSKKEGDIYTVVFSKKAIKEYSQKKTELRMVSNHADLVYSTSNSIYPYVKEATVDHLTIDGDTISPNEVSLKKSGDVQVHYSLTGYKTPFSLTITDNTKTILAKVESSAGAMEPVINITVGENVKTIALKYQVGDCSEVKTIINLRDNGDGDGTDSGLICGIFFAVLIPVGSLIGFICYRRSKNKARRSKFLGGE